MSSTCLICWRVDKGILDYTESIDYTTGYADSMLSKTHENYHNWKCVISHLPKMTCLKKFKVFYQGSMAACYLNKLLTAIRRNNSISHLLFHCQVTAYSDCSLKIVRLACSKRNIKQFSFNVRLEHIQFDKYIINLSGLIKKAKYLESVELSFFTMNMCNNVSSEHGTNIIHPLLQQAYEELFHVFKTHTSLKEIIFKRLPHNKVPFVLRWIHDLLDNPCITALTFTVIQSESTKGSLIEFMNKLACNHTLEYLKISFISMGGAGEFSSDYELYRSVGRVIKENATLKSLTLDAIDICIHEVECMTWGDAIASNTSLHTLSFEYASLNYHVKYDIVQGVNQNTTLRTLNLNTRYHFGYEEKRFSNNPLQLTNTSLHTLDVSHFIMPSLITYAYHNTYLTNLSIVYFDSSENEGCHISLLFETDHLKSLKFVGCSGYIFLSRQLHSIPELVFEDNTVLEEVLHNKTLIHGTEPYLRRNMALNKTLFSMLLPALNFIDEPSTLKRPCSSSSPIAKRLRSSAI